MPASIRAGTPTRPDLTLCLNRLILRHFQPEAATCVDAARQVSHNCGPKLSRREVGDLTHLNGDLIGGLSHSGGLAISV